MAAARIGRDGLPPVRAFVEPILLALRNGGGRASVSAMLAVAARELHLTDEQLQIAHDARRGKRSEVSYRMAWARTQLRARGIIDQVSRGEWALREALEE